MPNVECKRTSEKDIHIYRSSALSHENKTFENIDRLISRFAVKIWEQVYYHRCINLSGLFLLFFKDTIKCNLYQNALSLLAFLSMICLDQITMNQQILLIVEMNHKNGNMQAGLRLHRVVSRKISSSQVLWQDAYIYTWQEIDLKLSNILSRLTCRLAEH